MITDGGDMLDLAEIKRRRALTPPNWGTGIFTIPMRVADVDALIEEVERLRSDVIDAHLELIALDPLLSCGHHRSSIVGNCKECAEENTDAPEWLVHYMDQVEWWARDFDRNAVHITQEEYDSMSNETDGLEGL